MAKRETGVDVEETRVRLGKSGVLARATPHGHTREARGEFDVVGIQTTRTPTQQCKNGAVELWCTTSKSFKVFLEGTEQGPRGHEYSARAQRHGISIV